MENLAFVILCNIHLQTTTGYFLKILFPIMTDTCFIRFLFSDPRLSHTINDLSELEISQAVIGQGRDGVKC